MIIKNFSENDVELEINNLTFITGNNVQLLNNLYLYFKKYFSNYKYPNEELIVRNFNKYPTIIVNDKELSRDYYKSIFINSFEDLDEYLNITKGSLLFNYNFHIMEDLNIQDKLDEINILFDNLNAMISNKYPPSYIFEIDNIELNSEFFLKKNFKQTIKCNYNYKDKFIQLVDLIYDNYLIKPENYLLYIHGIDNLLNNEEYFDILNYIKFKFEKLEIFVVLSSKDSRYIFIDDYELVNILESAKIEKYLSEIELLKKINNNIEKFVTITPLELREFLLEYGSYLYDNHISKENNYIIEKALKTNKNNQNDTKIELDFEQIIEI